MSEIVLKSKLRLIKMVKSLFNHTFISIGWHQTKGGRRSGPMGVRGDIFTEKMWKQSRGIIWLSWLRQALCLGKPNWVFMSGCSCFIFLDLRTLTLVSILVCLCWLPRHWNPLTLMPLCLTTLTFINPILFKSMVLFTVFQIVTEAAKVPFNQNWPSLM